MKAIFIFLSFTFTLSNAQQTTNAWSILAKVSYKKAYDAILGIHVDKPLFSIEIKKLEGKNIRLKGYIIPTDGYKSHKEFIFSAFPYSSCFFCGQAGPETVVEIVSIEPIDYSSEPIEIEGELRLNDSDINRLMYQLTKVKKK